MFEHAVTDLATLRALTGEPGELARKKQLTRLDAHCRLYIAHAPMLLMATADAQGQCDVSPKGDAPGFVLVLDDRHLVIPERPGNRRLDGLRNILENPHIGLIFLVPRYGETLRVNGRATITRDVTLLDRLAVDGKRPVLAIGVEVQEAFLHCAKAFVRSALWRPDRWPDISAMTPAAQAFFDQAQPANQTVADVERDLDISYTKNLY